ncbi:MAG: alpha/beta hydrolase [Hyphomicrobiales bacterium]|nr:alpha/beta hydrolase [Hyphomicrobiales bacterium]
MMKSKWFSNLAVVSVIIICSFALSACASSSTSNSDVLDESSPGEKRKGEVYLLRGLANVFSLGMDTIGERMVARGLDAKVYNHTAWRSIADDIIARSKIKRVRYPVIIMGHSLGGNATMQMSKYLGDNGVKVSYSVSFDPTITTYVGPNVGEVINYYLPNSDNTNIVKQADGFTGSLRNVDVSTIEGVTHVTVEKNNKFQTTVINTTLDLAKIIHPKIGRVAEIDEP